MGTILGFNPFLSSVPSNSFKFDYINICTVEKSMKCFSRNPSTWYPPSGGAPREKAPADNWDIAQTSFELPWQICFSLNLGPIPCNSIFICTLRKYISAAAFICYRSCHLWFFFDSALQHFSHHTLVQKAVNSSLLVWLTLLRVKKDTGALVHMHPPTCPFSESPE